MGGCSFSLFCFFIQWFRRLLICPVSLIFHWFQRINILPVPYIFQWFCIFVIWEVPSIFLWFLWLLWVTVAYFPNGTDSIVFFQWFYRLLICPVVCSFAWFQCFRRLFIFFSAAYFPVILVIKHLACFMYFPMFPSLFRVFLMWYGD